MPTQQKTKQEATVVIVAVIVIVLLLIGFYGEKEALFSLGILGIFGLVYYFLRIHYANPATEQFDHMKCLSCRKNIHYKKDIVAQIVCPHCKQKNDSRELQKKMKILGNKTL